MQQLFIVLLLLIGSLFSCANSFRNLSGLPAVKLVIHKNLQDKKGHISALKSKYVSKIPLNARKRHLRNEFPEFTVTNALLAMNIIGFILTYLKPSLYNVFMKNNYRIANGQVYRLFSSLFIHADIYHLLTNSLSLSQIGPQVRFSSL
jgi:hypothetical protein